MEDKLTGLVSSIMSELKHIATTETIVGESVKLGDRMVVPVSKVMVGFGVGGGEGQDAQKGGGFGGGGGGGVRVEPVGFIVMDTDKISFLPTKAGKFEGLVEAIPGLIEKVQDFAKKRKDSKGKDKDKDQDKDTAEAKEE